MKFTFKEIADLIRKRYGPQRARDKVRILTRSKLSEVEEHLNDLQFVSNELQPLVNLCVTSEEECSITKGFDQEASLPKQVRRYC